MLSHLIEISMEVEGDDSETDEENLQRALYMTLEDEDNSDTDEENFWCAIEMTMVVDDDNSETDVERLQRAMSAVAMSMHDDHISKEIDSSKCC